MRVRGEPVVCVSVCACMLGCMLVSVSFLHAHPGACKFFCMPALFSSLFF